MLTRVICHDGLAYIGDVDVTRSNEYKLFLLGHMRFVWKRNISDMFEWDGNRWLRVHGHPTYYDDYLARGGTMWPGEFYKIVMQDDI